METKICNRCHRKLPNTKQYFPLEKGKTRTICRECDYKYKRFLENDENSRKKWTDKEIWILKEYYSFFTNIELWFFIFEDRTPRAIECCASKINAGHKTLETMERARRYGALRNPSCQKGRVITEEHRRHMSESKIKYFNPASNNTDAVMRSQNTRDKMSEIRISKGIWRGNSNPRHIKPLDGEMNGRWEGGITPLVRELRNGIIDWKMKSIEFCEYKCVVTGNRFDDIHHITPFATIFNEALYDLKLDARKNQKAYSSIEYDKLKELVIRKHSKYEIGCCLTKDVHRLFHNQYGYLNNTRDQFVDFLLKLQAGFFNNIKDYDIPQIFINKKYLAYLINEVAA